VGSEGHGRLSNQASGGVVIADALRFRLVEADPVFVRGDANRDGAVDLGDVLAVLFHLFGGRPATCADATDAEDSGKVSLADALSLLGFLLRGDRPPAPPSPLPGADPSGDIVYKFI